MVLSFGRIFLLLPIMCILMSISDLCVHVLHILREKHFVLSTDVRILVNDDNLLKEGASG